MANNVKILSSRSPSASKIVTSDNFLSQIDDEVHSSVITDLSPDSKNIVETDYGVIDILPGRRVSEIKVDLPFRVKFFATEFTAYGPTLPAPIGIAIIGVSNYIL